MQAGLDNSPYCYVQHSSTSNGHMAAGQMEDDQHQLLISNGQWLPTSLAFEDWQTVQVLP